MFVWLVLNNSSATRNYYSLTISISIHTHPHSTQHSSFSYEKAIHFFSHFMFLLSLPTVLCPFHVVYLLCSPCDFVILLDNAPPTDPLLLREWPREIRSELNFVMENYTFSGYFPTTSSSSNIASVCNSGNQFRQRQNRQRQRRVLVLHPTTFQISFYEFFPGLMNFLSCLVVCPPVIVVIVIMNISPDQTERAPPTRPLSESKLQHCSTPRGC